jgi:hypothetical protein
MRQFTGNNIRCHNLQRTLYKRKQSTTFAYGFMSYTSFLSRFVLYKMQSTLNETSIVPTIRRVLSSKDECPAILISAHHRHGIFTSLDNACIADILYERC